MQPFTAPQKKSRVIIPQFLLLLVLAGVFYGGIFFNLSLIELTPDMEKIVNYISIGLLTLLVVMGTFIAVIRSRLDYEFHQDGIHFKNKIIPYQEIQHIQIKTNLWDKLFKTYSIKLTKKVSLSNIPQTIQLADYLNQILAWAKQASQNTSAQQHTPTRGSTAPSKPR